MLFHALKMQRLGETSNERFQSSLPWISFAFSSGFCESRPVLVSPNSFVNTVAVARIELAHSSHIVDAFALVSSGFQIDPTQALLARLDSFQQRSISVSIRIVDLALVCVLSIDASSFR